MNMLPLFKENDQGEEVQVAILKLSDNSITVEADDKIRPLIEQALSDLDGLVHIDENAGMQLVSPADGKVYLEALRDKWRDPRFLRAGEIQEG